MSKKFTVITAAYNSEKTIERTINSILSQSQKNIEFIIVDGASTDKTKNIIKSFESVFNKSEISYKWISEPDKGIYDAWNKGLNMSTGDWISFLGSDDYYKPNAIENYNAAIKESNDNDIDWVYSEVEFTDGKRSKKLDSIWSWKTFRRNITITPAHVGSFHNKKYFKKYGSFNTNYKIAGDYELLLRARHNLKTLKVNHITAVMRADGVSNQNFSKVLKETLKAKTKSGKIPVLLALYDYIYMRLLTLIKRLIGKI
ncbi:MAG: glycosyltransferase [Winogradskyella sp.]|uniref:glycosyltransferase family 2 protein n=1 Tax=Winogradskyella sp. TaxID=1883156 RepID=UPI0026011A78|nr:glycosyltransferase family 2 protein [Winogradskyella sp.]NRB59549.1 glycosyltransferase [Winogradskyella sp.]